MSEGQPQPAVPTPPARTPDFRWQAFFQRAAEPLFVLNRRGRILFVNKAWESLTGVPASQARGWACTRRKPVEAGPWEESLRHLLCPPTEVHEGRPGRTRRRVPSAAPGRRWWDVEFFPLAGANGLLGVLGKVTVVTRDEPPTAPPPPEKLMALRERVAERHRPGALASRLPALRRVVEQVRLASQTRVPVLLVGEPGTGKRWVARTIHCQGLREQTFAALDCIGLPPAALADALFAAGGLVQRGAGTIYLAEPSRLPRDVQALLAGWLGETAPLTLPSPPGGEGRVRGAGACRVLAGCGVDPAAEVQAGRLLEELYCLLAPLVIALPPLRERAEDLPDLVEQFLERANGDGERRVTGLTPDAWDLVRAYHWPGNLRELYAVLQAARTHAAGERIDASDLPAPLRLAVRLERTPEIVPARKLALDSLLEEAERRLLVLALRKAQGNKSKAAEMLSIWRQRLVRRMEALGIPDHEN